MEGVNGKVSDDDRFPANEMFSRGAYVGVSC